MLAVCRIKSICLLLAAILGATSGHEESRKASERCCYPEQLHGEITTSRGLFHPLNDFQGTPIKFSVDYTRGLFWGEHEMPGPLLRRVQVVADIRDNVQSLYLRETLSNRCWRVSLGRSRTARCLLDNTRYRGGFNYNSGGSKHPRVGLIYERAPQSPNHPLLTWLDSGSHLVVDRDTCLPVLDALSRDLDDYVAFHKMREGLENLPQFWNHETRSWVVDNCESQEDKDEDDYTDIDTDSKRHEGILRRRRENREKEGEKRRLLRVLRGVDSMRSSDRSSGIDKIIQLDIYLYLLRHFFPRHPPEPCCRPNQWQASVTKSISYTYVQENYMGQSTTSIPHIYVDHINGRLAADIAEYTNGVQASNLSLLALFGQNTNTSTLALYVLDNAAPSCTYIQVTDVHGPMRNSCMPSTAQYERTVRLGGGPLNSVRLHVYNVTGVGPTNTSQLEYSAETYVTPQECMPMVEMYTWRTPSTKVTGTLLMSDARARITDPSTAFAVPSLCSEVLPVQLTYSQIESVLISALTYAGYQ